MIKVNRRLGRNVFWSMLLFAIFSFTLFNGTAFCEEAAESLAKSLMRNADVFRAAGDLDKAREVYRRVLADWPESDEAIPTEVELIVLDIKARDYSGIDTFLSRHSGEDISHHIFSLACECKYNGNDVKAVSLFRNFLEKWPDNEQAMLVHKELISADLRKGATADIDTRVANFLSTYAGHRFLPDAVYTLGNDCENVNADNAADSLYNYVINNWPESEQAMRARHRIFKADIDNKNFANLDAYIDEFLAAHATDKDFVDRVLFICNLFIRKNDPAMALPYINRALKVTTDLKQSIMLLKLKAMCYIDMGAEEQAKAVQEEIALYSEQEYYPGVQLAIADRYRKNGEYEKGIELYQEVIDSNSIDNHQLYAHAGIAKAKARMLGASNSSDVDSIVQQLMADKQNVTRLGYHVFQIGEEYYFRAVEAKDGTKEQSRADFQKAIAIWKKNINQINDSQHKCYAYYYSAVACRKIGDFAKALEYFNAVVADYPKSDKALGAQSAIADVYYRLYKSKVMPKKQAVAEIQSIYETVIEKWPDSPSLLVIRSFLNNLQ
ncbi:MAG: tetratricopeptide repeat protein [Planctomycetes bacterium]|nr:tetratricopeptide repeat protein [Planctomycetota bacterium]